METPLTSIGSRAGRITEIDGIRGLLSILVVIGHANYFGGSKDDLVIPWFWGTMEVFFVISGYLITGIALQNGASTARFRTIFFARRCLRIWPLYYVVLAFTILLTYLVLPRGWLGDDFNAWPGLAQCYLFLQNVQLLDTALQNKPVLTALPYAFGHSWSVALEEQFYLICGLLVPFLLRRTGGTRLLVKIIALAMIASFVLRVFGTHWWVLLSRFEGFGAGMLLAVYLQHRDSDRSSRQVRLIKTFLGFGGVAALGFAALSYIYPLPAYQHAVWGGGPTFMTLFLSLSLLSYSAFGLGLVGICSIRSGAPVLGFLRSRWLQWLGMISYSTYLWHLPMLIIWNIVLFKYVGIPQEFSMLVAIVPTFLVSGASYYLVERPFLIVGSRVRYKPLNAASEEPRELGGSPGGSAAHVHEIRLASQ
jgi:peptidoglycan/LPS O-acetylase OafA/YrhL